MDSPKDIIRTALRTLQPGMRMVAALGVRGTPVFIQKSFLEPLLNNIFAQTLCDDEFDFLRDKVLAVEVSDLKLLLGFTCKNNRLYYLGSGCQPTVTIRGGSTALLQLINREQDPDTLFFQRKLEIEGDTEVGLNVKNLLDAIDDEDLPGYYKRAVQVVTQCRQWLAVGDNFRATAQ